MGFGSPVTPSDKDFPETVPRVMDLHCSVERRVKSCTPLPRWRRKYCGTLDRNKIQIQLREDEDPMILLVSPKV